MASELVGQRLVHGSKNGRHEDVAEALAEIKKKYKKKKDRLTVTDLILDDCIYQFTPLMWSVRHNHVKCLDLLLDGGASVQTRCKHGGFTPLLLAAVYGNVECLKRLLEIGEEGKKKTTEHSTGQRRASPSVDGQKRREGVNIETTDSSGHTALLRAAMNGHVECVKALIEHSANIDAEHPETGDTSLILAAQNGKLDCVQLLLYHGASAAHKNNKGETAIHVASYWGHKPCVNLILTCMELPQLYDRR